MKTTDLRPWAVAVLASVYTAVFWAFYSHPSHEGGATPRVVWYDELRTIARADDPAPTPRPIPTRAPRIRTRSS